MYQIILYIPLTYTMVYVNYISIKLERKKKTLVSQVRNCGLKPSYYKGHEDRIKEEGRGGGGKWDWLGLGGGMGRKCRQL